MELAVELPTYQRSDLFAYNTNIIDASSLVSGEDLTPYNGPLNRIWEVSLNETEGAGAADGDEKGNGGIVAIIVVAAILVAGGIGAGVFFVLKNKKAQSANNTVNATAEAKQPETNAPEEEPKEEQPTEPTPVEETTSEKSEDSEE